jgi:hypothetical protein
MRPRPSNSFTTAAAGVASIGRTIGTIGIGAVSHMDTLTTSAPTSNIPTQIGAVLRVGEIRIEGGARLSLRQADQARTDFAIIEDDLEAICARRAKIPRNEVLRLAPSVSPPSWSRCCRYGKGCRAPWVGSSGPDALPPERAGVNHVYLHKLEQDASYRGVLPR